MSTVGAVELDQLRFFVAAATHGGYTGAADAEGVAQPHLFRRVQALQRELGVTVFERAGRNVRLTAAGERLLGSARAAIRAHEDLRREAELLKSGVHGVVRVSGYPIHIPRCLGPLICSFRTAHPTVAVDLSRIRDDRARDGDAVIADLLNGTVDFAIAPRQRGLGGVELYESHVVVVLPDDHPLRDAREVGLAAIEDQPLLVTPRGHYTREQVERCLMHLPDDCKKPYVAAQTSSAVALLALGEAGTGVPIVADLHLSDAQRKRRHPTLLGPNGPVCTTVMLFVHPTRPLSEPARLFMEHVEAQTTAAERIPEVQVRGTE